MKKSIEICKTLLLSYKKWPNLGNVNKNSPVTFFLMFFISNKRLFFAFAVLYIYGSSGLQSKDKATVKIGMTHVKRAATDTDIA